MAIFDPQCITFSQMDLIFNSRIYYRRLTTWTRAYLMARYFGIGTTEAQFERLYQETLDIGEMLVLIFGRQNAEAYSQLLSQYAIIFHQLIEAQMAGDLKQVDENVARLLQNVKDRSVFLEAMNPYWSAEGYQELFNRYIQLVIETANAIVEGDFPREVELYNTLNNHTAKMGNVFAEGIYAYLTSGGGGSNGQNAGQVQCITFEQMNQIYTIRMFWFEFAIWIRNYMISRYTNTGNSEEALARLMEVPVEFVTAIKIFFPEIDEEIYIELFTTYIGLIADFITAMLENNPEQLSIITQELYDNADKRAAFVAEINPFWTVEQWKDILYANLSTTIEESNTFLQKDYEKNIDIFTRLLDQAEISSTFLARGIFDYLTEGGGSALQQD